MKYENWDIGGDIVKDDSRYIVKDNTKLTNLVVSSTLLAAKKSTTGHRHAGQEEVYMFVSSTLLAANKSTTGHRHAGQEEVYMFVSGSGKMELDHKIFEVTAGDTVLIEDNVFHKVHNNTDFGLKFICVFDGGRNH